MRRITIGVAVAMAAAALAAAIPVAASSATSSPPKTVKATKLAPNGKPFLKVGTVVPTSELRWTVGEQAQRVYANHLDGLSVATDNSGATYPACTTNSGRTWKICGPHVHVAAANAPDVVTQLGADGSTYFIYSGPGGGGSVVVSANAGKTWYRASLPDQGAFAVVSDHVLVPPRLVAFCWTGSSAIAYTSTDGQTWTLAKTL
jgi:hypothetical protein